MVCEATAGGVRGLLKATFLSSWQGLHWRTFCSKTASIVLLMTSCNRFLDASRVTFPSFFLWEVSPLCFPTEDTRLEHLMHPSLRSKAGVLHLNWIRPSLHYVRGHSWQDWITTFQCSEFNVFQCISKEQNSFRKYHTLVEFCQDTWGNEAISADTVQMMSPDFFLLNFIQKELEKPIEIFEAFWAQEWCANLQWRHSCS